jgi:Domain of unknown function (DUF4249)
MIKRYFSWILFIIVLTVDSCIDPVDVELKSSIRKIVVDGSITNEPGPHKVILRYSQNADAKSTQAIPLTKAEVDIYEDDQVVQRMTEREPGVYYTDNAWRGTIGKTYTLRFVTPSDKVYESVPQVLNHPGYLDSLYARFKYDGILIGSSGSDTQDAIEVFVDSRNVPGGTGHFRWKFTGMFHARTYPELKILDLPGGAIPNPPPCSGYIYELGELVKVGECTCCDCWPFDFNNTISISQGQFTNQLYKEVMITRVPATSLRFINRYYIEMEQFSLSEEVHTFWRLVKALQEASGNIFQPNAVKVRGNIRAVDSDEDVVGIFAVSGVTRKKLFLDSLAIPYRIFPDIRADECTIIFGGALKEKPSFWP